MDEGRPGVASGIDAGRAARRREAAVSAAGLGVVLLYFALHAVSKIARGKMGDFPHFYYAAEAMRSGRDIYASWHQGYLYPPTWAYLIQPLASLRIQSAAVVQAALDTAAVVGAIVLASRTAQERMSGRVVWSRVLTGALVTTLILSNSIRAELEMGQTNSWVLLGAVLAWWAVDRWPWVAGVALGFAFNIKFQTVAFLPYLLVRRRWAAAAWFGGAILFWSVLPSIQTGWTGNLHDLRVAYAGVLDLVGIETGTGVTAKNPLGASFSLSVTSAMSRFVGPDRDAMAWALSFGVLALLGVAAMVIYRKGGVAWVRWPNAAAQRGARWQGQMAMEWAGVVVVALAFSPQTNSRHLVLLVIPVAVGAAIVLWSELGRRGGLAALIVLACGLMLPPGSEATHEAVRWWRGVGGEAWCILVCYALILQAGTRWLSHRFEEAASPPPGAAIEIGGRRKPGGAGNGQGVRGQEVRAAAGAPGQCRRSVS